MTHYIPLQTATGWAVAYGNHRGEFVAVMECQTLEGAYSEARQMTISAYREYDARPGVTVNAGNRYMRRFQQ